jgi:hypothetical protein
MKCQWVPVEGIATCEYSSSGDQVQGKSMPARTTTRGDSANTHCIVVLCFAGWTDGDSWGMRAHTQTVMQEWQEGFWTHEDKQRLVPHVACFGGVSMSTYT